MRRRAVTSTPAAFAATTFDLVEHILVDRPHCAGAVVEPRLRILWVVVQDADGLLVLLSISTPTVLRGWQIDDYTVRVKAAIPHNAVEALVLLCRLVDGEGRLLADVPQTTPSAEASQLLGYIALDGPSLPDLTPELDVPPIPAVLCPIHSSLST